MGAPDLMNRYHGMNSMVEEASSEAVGGNRVQDREMDPSIEAVREGAYRSLDLAVDTSVIVLALIAMGAAVVFLTVLLYG